MLFFAGRAWAMDGSLKDAIAAGDIVQVRALLDAGAPVNTRDDLGRTPLLDAVWADRADMVRLLIERGADVSARHSDGGSTPLDYAVVRGNLEIAAMLIRGGAPPDENALSLAAGRDDAGLARLLIDAGAMVSGEAGDAVDQAVRHRSFAVLSLLLDKYAGRANQLLAGALSKGDAPLLRVLAEHGADLNRTATPLHDAAARGYVGIVEFLLERGFEINAREPDSQATPLYDAASMGRTEVVAVLLDRGANPNIPNKAGNTALHAAATNGFTATAELLRKRGARENSGN